MKRLWNSFKIAFAMFSRIPVPQAEWTEENMRYMLCFFPWVGAVIGLLTFAAAFLGRRFAFEDGFVSVLLTLIPVIVTGGIHVDGLLDTADAMSSWRDRERRLEILKDSHTGAFAVITACVYFLCCCGALLQIYSSSRMEAFWVLGAGFMVSRALSGLGVVTFPKARTDGTVAEFSRKSGDIAVRNVLILYLALLLALMLRISPVYGAAAYLTALAVFAYYHHMAMKYFGGTTGDLSGCFLCLCEAGMALVLAAAVCIW